MNAVRVIRLISSMKPGWSLRKGIDGFWYACFIPSVRERPTDSWARERIEDALEICQINVSHTESAQDLIDKVRCLP